MFGLLLAAFPVGHYDMELSFNYCFLELCRTLFLIYVVCFPSVFQLVLEISSFSVLYNYVCGCGPADCVLLRYLFGRVLFSRFFPFYIRIFTHCFAPS